MQGISELEQIVASVKAYHPDAKFYFDLCEMHSYNYHTGVVFSAFRAGSGEELALGGRYDHIGEVFGRARPATGFSTDLLKLSKISGATQPIDELIYAPAVNDVELSKTVKILRQQGRKIVGALANDNSTPGALGCRYQLQKQGDEWAVVEVGSNS
jgi:ATP phosphoribosyltransferase regulatory subunit